MDLTKIKMISGDFDRSLMELKMGMEGKFGDGNEAGEAISKLAEAVDRVDHEMKILKSSLEGNQSISQLKLRIESALNRREENEKVSVAGDLLSTPLKNATLSNFEDFPSTPTLEELGLSGRTLSIVGRRVGSGGGGFDSSASLSDTEFDNSFYQKSPVGGGADNSFSSDVSVPNFKIFNSSPVTKAPEPRRTKSHNLKQVTNANNASSDTSMVMDEDEQQQPLTKKVHFSEGIEIENQNLNKNF